MMILDRRTLVRLMALVGMAVLLPATPVMAQAQFPWAEERPGFMNDQYQFPFMCGNAFYRVYQRGGPKTLPLAVDTLRRCRQSRQVAALADKRDFSKMQWVLAQIGDSAAYFELLERRVALYAGPYEQWEPLLRYHMAYYTSPPHNNEDISAELPDVFPASDSSVKVMRAIGPRRLVVSQFVTMQRERPTWAEHILKRYQHLFGKERAMRNRMWKHRTLLDSSIEKGDTASWRARLAIVVAFADSMTEANVLLTPDEWAELRSLQARTALRLDSIPVTNADIWPRQVANTYKTFTPDKNPPDAFLRLGEIAPPIEGTFWYRATGRGGDSAFTKIPSPSPLPAKGRWTLVVSTPPECDDNPATCADKYMGIAEFQRRYGEKLDVIHLSSIRGAFLKMEPPTPEQEAEAIARYLFGFHKLPGTLSVMEAQFRQLPKPDLRWHQTSKVASERLVYTQPIIEGRNPMNVPGVYGVLVDPQGRIMARGVEPIVHSENSLLFDALIK